MIDDTRIGGPSSKFPVTRRSAIVLTGSTRPDERRQAFEKIVAAYWKPVYKFIRLGWSLSSEDAKDLTQAFFTRAMEKHFFKEYIPDKSSFRTFIRVCATHFVINESKYAQRTKRGGDTQPVPLENAKEPVGESLDEFFEREWTRHLFSLAVADLRDLCKERSKPFHFEIFEAYDLDCSNISYGDLARRHGVSVTDVTNYLAWCRREFRWLVLDRLREVTSDDAEFRREAKVILGGRFDDFR